MNSEKDEESAGRANSGNQGEPPHEYGVQKAKQSVYDVEHH